ncbi:MAG: hypothetical protein ACRD6X_08170 [Pyrinomonadaceae bacterium]
MKKVDMSSKSVTRRLRQSSDLRELSIALMKARKSHNEKLAKDTNNSLNKTTETEHSRDNAA